jgi:hypothetical protein
MRTNCGPIILKDDTKKAGHQLLDHQCWVLGKDVLSPEGNLLCEFGFHQVRCPNGGLTQYELKNALGLDALGKDAHVYLWGFGVFFGGEEEGIFLGRKDFKPSRTLGRVELHTKDYPDFNNETSRLDLFLQGLAWFASYEQWITRRMPDKYRELCLATFPRKALPGREFSQRWRDLIHCIEKDQGINEQSLEKDRHAWDVVLSSHESARNNFTSSTATLLTQPRGIPLTENRESPE